MTMSCLPAGMETARRLRAAGLVPADEADESVTLESIQRHRYAITTVSLHGTPRWLIKTPCDDDGRALMSHERTILEWLAHSSARTMAPVLGLGSRNRTPGTGRPAVGRARRARRQAERRQGVAAGLVRLTAADPEPRLAVGARRTSPAPTLGGPRQADRFWAVDGRADTLELGLVTAYVPGDGSADGSTASAETLGVLLGCLHKATPLADDESDRRELPVSPIAAGMLPRLAAPAAELQDTARALAFVRRQWRPGVPIHGDLKWEHIRGVGETVLIDWELAGAGDPAWDVASLCHELLIAGASVESLNACLRAYGAAIGRVVPDAFLVRCAASLAVRFVQSAGEFEMALGVGPMTVRSLTWAAWWAGHPDAFTIGWRGAA